MITKSQCEGFLAGGGFRATQAAGADEGLAAMQSTLSELLKSIKWGDLFSKSMQLFQIWSDPDWSAAAILKKVATTYALFNVTPPTPAPVST